MKRFALLTLISVFLISCGAKTTVGINKTNMSRAFDPARINRVAIVDFEKTKSLNYDSTIVADKFTAELVGSEIFSLMDRNDIKKIMYEVGFQQKSSLSGILNDATLQRLSAMGADSILTGNLVSFRQQERNGLIIQSEAHLIAKLLRIESGEVVWSAEMEKRSRTNKGEDALPAEVLLSDIIEEMCKPLNSEGTINKLLKKLK